MTVSPPMGHSYKTVWFPMGNKVLIQCALYWQTLIYQPHPPPPPHLHGCDWCKWLNRTSSKRDWKAFTHPGGGTLSMSHRVALWGSPASLVYVERTKETAADRRKVVGMVILKCDDLAWGAGKRSLQNKWEVNTQPQEAINCSKDQLGLSRCSWPPALVLPSPPCLWRSPSISSRRWTVAVFHLLSSLRGKEGVPEAFIAPALPPTHQVQVIREGNYVLLKRLSFYRWGR